MHELRRAVLLSLWLLALAGCDKRPDMSPPPLNPHPKEAVHVHVSFDDPEDAKRYTLTMQALYQNQQRECGYVDYWKGGSFSYPNDTFDIPNESTQEGYADFTIYLDRYDRETCNWEFASPGIRIHDTHTGRTASSTFHAVGGGTTPGTVLKDVCLFMANDYPQECWSKTPPPDVPHYSRIPITIRVSEDSAPLRPPVPGYFSNFVKPIDGSLDISSNRHP